MNYVIVQYYEDAPYLVVNPPDNINKLVKAYFDDEDMYEQFDSFAEYLASLGIECVRPETIYAGI